jgi:transposase
VHVEAKTNEAARRLQTIPGIGPITASALVATLPDVSEFRSGRDLFAVGHHPETALQRRQG